MDCIYLGKIVNTHGIKGEVRILSEFDKKKLVFKKGFNIYIGKNFVKETINSYRVHKNYDMVTFEGINDINDVLKYKGSKVYFDRNDLNLNNNDFLLQDLIGLKVISGNKTYGIVKDIVQSKANLLLQVLNNDKIYYVPYIKEYIGDIDINDGFIVIERAKEFYEI